LTGGGATPPDWRDTLYYRYIDGGHGVARHSAIRTNEFKLLYFDRPRNEAEEKARWELFDLKTDPQEMNNLVSDPAYASQLKQLKERFWKAREYYDDTDESVWDPRRTKRYRPEAYIRQRR
jgi:arylsulfatase A-like enzyme